MRIALAFLRKLEDELRKDNGDGISTIGQIEIAQRELECSGQLVNVFRRKPNVTVEKDSDRHMNIQ
jgi:hypothetical protein